MKSTFKKSIIAAAFLFGAVSISNAQVKVGANPTTIGTNSNLEVEAANGNKTIVNKNTGQVTIQDGTQGNGKILTSDAAGNASWRAQKLAEVTSFPQTTGAIIWLPPVGSFVSCSAGTDPIGSPVPSCATDLNMNGTFSISNPMNDVIIDFTGFWVSTTSGTLDMEFAVYIDKTTPGVFEKVSKFVTINPAAVCAAESFNYKTTLQNLPARTYNIKVYAGAYNYGGSSTGAFGIGQASAVGCGSGDLSPQSLVVTVSQ